MKPLEDRVGAPLGRSGTSALRDRAEEPTPDHEQRHAGSRFGRQKAQRLSEPERGALTGSNKLMYLASFQPSTRRRHQRKSNRHVLLPERLSKASRYGQNVRHAARIIVH
jgi:hypothetical protein